jgi:hypothetical protein
MNGMGVRRAKIYEPERAALLAADPEARATHETILRLLSALDNGEITESHAQRVLDAQAMRLADEPATTALYRQTATAIRQMQREEH